MASMLVGQEKQRTEANINRQKPLSVEAPMRQCTTAAPSMQICEARSLLPRMLHGWSISFSITFLKKSNTA